MTNQAQTHKRRHHRRGPAKRFLLATGPFFFLIAAFGLSAGVVEIIEETPEQRPALTLAEERALAPLEIVEPESAGAPTRLEVLPGSLLAGSDYDYLERGSATASSGELDSEGLQEDFRFPISNRPELLPGSGPRRGADLPDPDRFDLQSR